MKQETIGSKGTVPGFRPLIGSERWHKENFSKDLVAGGYRPLLLGEAIAVGDQWHTGATWLNRNHFNSIAVQGSSKHRTKRPLPPPAVETFEAHSHIWYKHTPGDECPVEPDAVVAVIFRGGNVSRCNRDSAKTWYWNNDNDSVGIIGYRFPDYPAVHTILQQEQSCVVPPLETIPTQFSTEQRLTSLYNDWCFLPPETVAECIADVASVLYPTDAERCEAAFQRWFKEWGYPGVAKGATDIVWHAAWKAAKESKV